VTKIQLKPNRLIPFLIGVLVLVCWPGGALSQHLSPKAKSHYQVSETSVTSFWIIYISSETLDAYNDPELSIKPVVKVKVGVASAERSVRPYEDLWYGTEEPGFCLGERRYSALGIPSRDYVAIRLLDDRDLSVTQLNASADALSRVLLDTQLNDDWIEAVIVPDRLFDPVREHLRFYGMTALGEGESVSTGKATFDFILKSTSGRQSATMVHRT
jgi:hypothetical protein